MSYPINYPTPQGANIQIFQAGGRSAAVTTRTWVKPQGASFVWFTLIGGGGGGGGSGTGSPGGGGGSAAVTNCMVPAFLIPDNLIVNIGYGGAGGDATGTGPGGGGGQSYVQNVLSGSALLTGDSGAGGGGDVYDGGLGGGAGSAISSNFFSCMGFYQSVIGQLGADAGLSITASAVTFTSGGNSGTAGATTANYGYSSNTSSGNFFQMQPIIVGLGGNILSGSLVGTVGGIGCGGGGAGNTGAGGKGGDGLVVIITW